MPNAYHFLISAWNRRNPLADREACVRLWKGLRERFKTVLACIFMPEHVHLVLETSKPEQVRWELSVEARAISRALYRGTNQWQPAFAPEKLPNSLHLLRTIRYVHLNANRRGLVRDPIEWEWSTHRDVLGATSDCWVDLERLSEIMNCPRTALARRFHAYVSGDPSAAVQGTPPLQIHEPGNILLARPLSCIEAIGIAARTDFGEAITRGPIRDAFVTLARKEIGIPAQAIAAELGITARTVSNILGRPVSPELIRAALNVLNDSRCRREPPKSMGVNFQNWKFRPR